GRKTCRRDGHSSGNRVAAALEQPTRMTGLEKRPAKGLPLAASSLFGLAPGGVCRAVPVARSAVRSYRTLSPLPAEAGGLLSVALSLGSPPAAVSRHRISMEPGLSSARRQRPPGQLARAMCG